MTIKKPIEIGFKFRINRETINKAFCIADNDPRFIVVPKFEVFIDEYFRKNNSSSTLHDSFLQKRSVITFDEKFNDIEKCGIKYKFYPNPEFEPIINYIRFLECGIGSFKIDPVTRIYGTKNKEIFYILKQKYIENGVEKNKEYEIKSNENDIDFITKIMEYNNYSRFYLKTKREAFHIVPVGDEDIEKYFSGCRIKIVSVTKTNYDVIYEYYAEVEFSSNRLIYESDNNMQLDSIEKNLNLFTNLIFGLPLDYLDLIKIPL